MHKILTSFALTSSIILLAVGCCAFLYDQFVPYFVIFVVILLTYHSGITFGRNEKNLVSQRNLLTPLCAMIVLTIPMPSIQLLLCIFMSVIQYLFDKLSKPTYDRRQMRSRFIRTLLAVLVCLAVLVKDYIPKRFYSIRMPSETTQTVSLDTEMNTRLQ